MPVYLNLGREFMPPLNEGTILYMPTTTPGMSVTQAQALLETQDRILKSFPEVETRLRQGRPRRHLDRSRPLLHDGNDRRAQAAGAMAVKEPLVFLLGAAPGSSPILRRFWYDRITCEELKNEMDRALQIPGSINAWTMPIKGRIDMLTTGVRTPVGIKILGSDLNEIQRLGEHWNKYCRRFPARAASLPSAPPAATSSISSRGARPWPAMA